MCLRHFGIDSYAMVEVRQHEDYGLEYVYYRSDGLRGKMCGNGARVFASFVKISGIHAGTDDVTFLAGDGVHYGNYDSDTEQGWASIKDISESNVNQISPNEYILNTGVPHMVVFVDFDVQKMEDFADQAKVLSKKWSQYRTETSSLLVSFVREEKGILHARCFQSDVCKEDISCGT